MQNMTANRAVEVYAIMKAMQSNASAAFCRVRDVSSVQEMTEDQVKALAKEVEEVGELIKQLEKMNPHIVPALFEIPYRNRQDRNWQGWDGLKNYRNILAHKFRTESPERLFRYAKKKLRLDEVSDLLEAVTSVETTTKDFSFGHRSDVKKLPQTPEGTPLRAGASIIVLRFEESGELMAARSWRNDQDDWRASVRWVRTLDEKEKELLLCVQDTEFRLVPRPISPDEGERYNAYNLMNVPNASYCWHPETISQRKDCSIRKKRE